MNATPPNYNKALENGEEWAWKKRALWFKGRWYEDGDEVINKSDNSSHNLTASELSIYDFIIGSCLTGYDDDFKPFHKINPNRDEKLQFDIHLSLNWFKEKNIKKFNGLGLDKIWNQFISLGIYNEETGMFYPNK